MRRFTTSTPLQIQFTIDGLAGNRSLRCRVHEELNVLERIAYDKKSLHTRSFPIVHDHSTVRRPSFATLNMRAFPTRR